MNRKTVVMTAAVVAALAIPSGIAWAATQTFTHGGSGTTLTVKNTSGTGKALFGKSVGGITGKFERTKSSGTNPALQGVTHTSATGAGVEGRSVRSGGGGVGVKGLSKGVDGTGVWGVAPGSSGVGGVFEGDLFGAFGIGSLGLYGVGAFGVEGDGAVVGVAGWTPGIGDGTYGVWSASDAGVSGHLHAYADTTLAPADIPGDVAGFCTLPLGETSVACAFPTPFFDGVVPVVVLTPTSDPGDFYWVSAGDENGFTITIGSIQVGDVTFGYHVIGLDAVLEPPA
ncbi:MAG TPA: hypothetical protein VGB83_07495 [Actinomycetota bacterium]